MAKIWKYNFDIAKFTKAIELNPGDYVAYKNRGNAYHKKMKYDLAIADYNKAIELNPAYFLAYNNRGNVYQQLRQYERAIADYDKAIELNPDNGMPYNNRGFTFLLMGKHDAAEENLMRSLELNPNNIYALNSMSELNAARNNAEEACNWLRKAIEKGYNNWNYLKMSRTYDNVRNAPCFQRIIEKTCPPERKGFRRRRGKN